MKKNTVIVIALLSAMFLAAPEGGLGKVLLVDDTGKGKTIQAQLLGFEEGVKGVLLCSAYPVKGLPEGGQNKPEGGNQKPEGGNNKPAMHV